MKLAEQTDRSRFCALEAIQLLLVPSADCTPRKAEQLSIVHEWYDNVSSDDHPSAAIAALGGAGEVSRGESLLHGGVGMPPAETVAQGEGLSKSQRKAQRKKAKAAAREGHESGDSLDSTELRKAAAEGSGGGGQDNMQRTMNTREVASDSPQREDCRGSLQASTNGGGDKGATHSRPLVSGGGELHAETSQVPNDDESGAEVVEAHLLEGNLGALSRLIMCLMNDPLGRSGPDASLRPPADAVSLNLPAPKEQWPDAKHTVKLMPLPRITTHRVTTSREAEGEPTTGRGDPDPERESSTKTTDQRCAGSLDCKKTGESDMVEGSGGEGKGRGMRPWDPCDPRGIKPESTQPSATATARSKRPTDPEDTEPEEQEAKLGANSGTAAGARSKESAADGFPLNLVLPLRPLQITDLQVPSASASDTVGASEGVSSVPASPTLESPPHLRNARHTPRVHSRRSGGPQVCPGLDAGVALRPGSLDMGICGSPQRSPEASPGDEPGVDEGLWEAQVFEAEVKWLESMRVKSLVPALLALVPVGGRVLQLGAATSFLAVRLARHHPCGAIYAVDPLKEWVSYLRARASMEGLPNLRPIYGNVLDPRLELPEDMDLVIIVMMQECASGVDWLVFLESLRGRLCSKAFVALMDASESGCHYAAARDVSSEAGFEVKALPGGCSHPQLLLLSTQ